MENRRDWKRPVIVLVALGALTVATLAAPVSAHLGSFGHLKSHIKKIAKKVATKEIGSATIEQGTIPPVTASVGDPSKPVLVHGPFTVTLDCVDNNSVRLLLKVRTTEENSTVNDNGSILGELDPSDGDQAFVAFDGDFFPGGQAVSEYSPYYGSVFLKSPSGTSLFAMFDPVTNFRGSHCYVDGWFLDLAA